LFWYEDVAIGINICEDIWIEDGPAEDQVKNGASLIININASPYDINKSESRKEIVKNKAAKLKVPIIYLNMVGGQDELVFDGGSFVVDETGEIIYQASQFDEEVFHLDLDLLIKRSSDKPNLDLRTKSLELESRVSAPTLTENESIYSALKLGLFDYVTKNNFKKVLIGISGGIDSALTAAICVDALGSENVIGVAMPSKYNSDESLDDAKALSKNLNMELKVIEIEPLVEIFRNTLSSTVVNKLSQVTDENIQSRVRGNILMGLSNQTGAMVVSTGNKSEMAVGYSTLYGDLAGGYALLKDLYKTKVYDLSNFRNSHSEVIPENIILKEPSAELRPNQIDKDSLPDYEELDTILNLYIENDSSSESIIATGIEASLVYDVLEKVDRNEYKRKQVAPGVKLTEKAFGKDRRMPITNTYIRQRD
jgi:NAD+ synthase (glutamine-hydrolysing)